MLFWIVDNFSLVLLFLGIVALGRAAAWWRARKYKMLFLVGIPVALMALVWLLQLFVVTDRMQLARDVQTMRDLVNAGRIDDALQHFEDEVKVDTSQGELTVIKAALKDYAKNNMRAYGVKKIDVWAISVEDLSRPNATVSFYIKPQESEERGRCRMGFVLGSDKKWRVKTFTVESLIGGKKAPLLFPF